MFFFIVAVIFVVCFSVRYYSFLLLFLVVVFVVSVCFSLLLCSLLIVDKWNDLNTVIMIDF